MFIVDDAERSPGNRLAARALILAVVALLIIWRRVHEGAPVFITVDVIFCLYLAAAYALYLDHLAGRKQLSLYLAVAADCLAIGAGIMLSGASLSPFFFLFLIIIVGNTVNYGRNLMIFSTLFSLAVYTTVILASIVTGEPGAFSEIQWSVEAGKIMVILIIPIFMDRLLHILSEKIEKAQEIDRLKTQFLNNFSHEFRTPLHNIIGFAELLRQPGLPQDKREKMLDIIRQRSGSLLNIMEKITEMTFLMSGETPLTIGPVNLSEFIPDVLESHRQNADEKSIKFVTGVNLELTTVELDHDVVKKILNELIDNAIKFSKEGSEVMVEVSLNGSDLAMDVTDTGSGIAEKDQQPIFELFRQMDQGLNRRFEGLGAGLFMVKLLVNLHGGDIEMQSSEGKGSTFKVNIPVKVVTNKKP